MTTKLLLCTTIVLTGFAAHIPAQSVSGNVPKDWETAAESSDYVKTPRYAETIAFSKRLDAQSREIVYKSFGKSSEGRDLPLLIAARKTGFSPETAKASGKPVVLIQAAIHAGESDGKDAGLALFRDIAITKERADLLENAILLFIPIYNVDGHELFGKFNRINQNGPEEMGFRANSANQNLNRDYLKADTAETRAWLRLWNEWEPDFFIDCHVTDGADFQYNITYEFAHHDEIDSGLKDWMKNRFEKDVIRKVESHGSLLSRYIQLLNRYEPNRGIASFIATPRFATGYVPLRNRIGLLIEAHSVKPYKSRVRGTYDVLWHMIEEIGADKNTLLRLNNAADSSAPGWSPGRRKEPFVLSQRIGNQSSEYLYKGFEIKTADSLISGGKKLVYTKEPKNYVVPQYDKAVPAATVVPPYSYIIPPQWHDVIDRLRAHGVKMSRTISEQRIEIESYRFQNPKWRSRPFEGRLTMTFDKEKTIESRMFPADSVVIPMTQKAAKVAVHFLEPDGPDSAMFWGFFNSIFEQKEYSESYVMEGIAEEMLAKDDALRKEFEERLKDPEFAANPRARLRFFYQRSPYYDRRIGLYPVGRIVNAAQAMRPKTRKQP